MSRRSLLSRRAPSADRRWLIRFLSLDANPRFYDISGVDPNGSLADWRFCIMEEYQANVEQVWREATALKPKNHHKPAAVATTMEFRWKKDQNWVLFE